MKFLYTLNKPLLTEKKPNPLAGLQTDRQLREEHGTTGVTWHRKTKGRKPEIRSLQTSSEERKERTRHYTWTFLSYLIDKLMRW